MKHKSDLGDTEEQALVSQRPARMTGVVPRARYAQVVSLDEARGDGRAPAWEAVEVFLQTRRNADRIEAWAQRSAAFAGVLRVLRGLDALNGVGAGAPLPRALSGADRAPPWLLRRPCVGES